MASALKVTVLERRYTQSHCKGICAKCQKIIWATCKNAKLYSNYAIVERYKRGKWAGQDLYHLTCLENSATR